MMNEHILNKLDDNSSVYTNKSNLYHLLKCPICFRCFDDEENCFEHFMNYFENSQHFLFRRSDLIFWLNKYASITLQKVTTDELPVKHDENENSLTELNLIANDCGKSEEWQTYRCEICNRSFSSEEEISVHSFIHVSIQIPAIDFQLKCPLCDKYFSNVKSCLVHIFTHMKISSVRGTRMEISSPQSTFQFIEKWITIFFRSKSCDKILTKYNLYEERLSSSLLSKILLSEIKALKNCKFCKKSVTSVFDLLENHRNCKIPNSIKSCVCVLCNFKATDIDCLMLHFFRNHIVCYCGFHGDDFNSFLEHSVKCVAQKNGIICPCCYNINFLTEGAFKEHIAGSKSKSCGSYLKKNKWVCVLCKAQSSQKDMFNHIFMEHVSCLCGYKSKDMKTFFIHTRKCNVKKNTLCCPICRKIKCSSENLLQQHVSRCLPWKTKEPDQDIILEQVETKGEAFKRKYEQFVEKSSKRTKINFELSCVNCTSQ